MLNCCISTRSEHQILSIPVVITRRRVKLRFIGLCNSSANCCYQLIPDGFSSLNQDQVSVLCLLHFLLTSDPIVVHYKEWRLTILPFYGQLYFCTFGYHRKHYNQHHVAWPQHRLAQLVDHKFLIFHQFLDCILLGFLNHYRALCIYGLVRSIRLLVLVIYQSVYGYL